PRPELVLATAVEANPALLARLDRCEQLAHRPETRRLDVQPVRLERQSVEIGKRVDRRGEAQAIFRARERLAQTVLQPRILDDHVGELLDDRAIELRIGREVDARAAVVRLQVDDPDTVELTQMPHKRPVPLRLGIELELQLGRDLEPPIRFRASRHDEAKRLLLTPERFAETELVLPEREIEQRALEGPASVALRQLLE